LYSVLGTRHQAGIAVPTIDLASLPTDSSGSLLPSLLRKKLAHSDGAPLLLIHVPAGASLPPLSTLPRPVRQRLGHVFAPSCHVHRALCSADGGAEGELEQSEIKVEGEIAAVGRTMRTAQERKQIGRRLGWVVRGRHELGLDNLTGGKHRIHVRAWQAAAALASHAASDTGAKAKPAPKPSVAP